MLFLRRALAVAAFGIFAAAPAWAAPKWTILIYGHGDHNLSPSLVEDFLEMQRAGSSADFRIVLQTDFQRNDRETYTEGLPREFGAGVTRWLVTPSQTSRVQSAVLERLPELNSDRGRNLADFIQWGLSNFPADRYGLILWDHGGSWTGFGADEQDGRVKRPRAMGLNEITAALRAGMAGRVAKMDFLSFDACLMGNQEVIAAMQPFADLLIANAEIDYGPGWDYEASLGWLKNNPAASMRDFAAADAAAYRKHHDALVDRFFMAHLAYDNAAAAEFTSAASAFAAQLRRHFSARVARAVREAPTYDIGGLEPGPLAGDNPLYVDLPRMADLVSHDRRIPLATRRAARGVVRATNAMRLAKVLGLQKRDAGGVNAYLPLSTPGRRSLRQFARLNVQGELGWSRVLRAALRSSRGHRARPVLPDSVPAITAPAGGSVVLNIPVLAGDPYAIEGILIGSVGGKTVSLGEAGRVVVNRGARTYQIGWDALVVRIGDLILPTREQQETPLLFTEVEFLEPGSDVPTYGTIGMERQGNHVIPITATAAPIGVAPRGYNPPAGTEVHPLLMLADKLGVTRRIRSAQSFTIPAGGLRALPLTIAPLPAGTYDLRVVAEDAFGAQSHPLTQRVTLQ
jgi:hypothetical protein